MADERNRTKTRLTNEQWGFSSNCFVCEPANGAGLRIPFFHDHERDIVTAEFELTDAFSGAPSYVHGGVSLAVLDEVQAWATIAVAGKFAVTTRTSAEFLRPVRVGKTYTLEGEVVSVDGDTIATVGRILDPRGEVRVQSEATFLVLSAAIAADAIGEVSGDDTAFLRD
ncbi:PaaI family thioesterase [Actinospongicola halichondriae]|uniref:PaaI family thioesterase n=1 Tax=Actinospongicola halichondriae TaxID=3236844 RepID=UPI003D40A119